jgi:predicted amidohydrolase YtcJ
MRVLSGGPVYGMADATAAEAVAYHDGCIVAIGPAAHVMTVAGPGAEVTDLGGRAVVPGFVDAHHHVAWAALYRGAVDCRPCVAGSIDAVLRRVRAAAAVIPPGAWVLGFGYDDWALEERRAPTRQDLDAACPDHPLLLVHASAHRAVANSRALALAGIGRTSRDPAGGRIERGRHGEPTGRLYETAMATAERLAAAALTARDPEGVADRLAAYERELFALGITRVADPTVTTDLMRLYRQAHAEGRLRLPVVMMPVSDHGYLVRPDDVLGRLDGEPTGAGPEVLCVGPLKLFFDGADDCALCVSIAAGLASAFTLALRVLRTRTLAPLRVAGRARGRLGRDRRLHLGLRAYPTDEHALRVARDAVTRGFALAVHAVGNEAVAQAVRVLGAVRARHPAAWPPRIEHATFTDDTLLAAIADRDLTVVSQPSFVRLPVLAVTPAFGRLRVLALRRMLEARIRLAGSSDGPVVSIDPLDGVRDAVFRRMPDGRQLAADEAVEPLDALGMYTRAAAAACGSLDVTGTLAPGKRADLLVLSGDPRSRADLPRLRVGETILGGVTVFRAGEAEADVRRPGG